jgi:S-DNA-T family DNA segregation ATPase FtsK/SpoIIIE
MTPPSPFVRYRGLFGPIAVVLLVGSAILWSPFEPHREPVSDLAELAGILPTWADEDWAIFAQKVDWAGSQRLDTVPIGDAMAAIGRTFVGTAYVPQTLEAPGPEGLVINFRGLDCVTFVENVLALSRFVRTYGADAPLPILNVILASLLYKRHPSQLKFVLVDPKKVEMSLFSKIERHYLAKLPNSEEAIITDTRKVVHTLNSLCIEMENRYEIMKDAGARNIKEYNTKFVGRKLNPKDGHRFLPYIVLVIDELADLMMTAGKEVETPIARLAQLARAIGIHLVVATQRPSVNVITGVIKANFPARLSFKVTSKVDSRTILDTGGADQLVGMGDMLLSSGSDIIRIQSPFVDTPEVEKICEFIGSQRGYESAYLLPEYEGDDESGANQVDLSERDALFEEAARLIVAHQQGSTSLIQRKLKLGYNRAGRLIDQLEAAGIVGPFEGSKAREVLIRDEMSLEQLLNSLKEKHGQ